jgi:hypothetical protein
MRSSAIARFMFVASVLGPAAIAACGGGGGGGPSPKVPASSSSSAPTPGSGTSGTGSGTSGTSGTSGAGSSAVPVPTGAANKPIAPSAMAAQLKELGLDPKKLPPIEKLDAKQKRDLMNTFTKAVGAQCKTCHDMDHLDAPTPMKKLTARMWNEWVRGVTFEDGSLVYCDSCHQGRLEFLDRHDKKAVSDWMADNFVSKLKRVDAKDQSCERCHGDKMEMRFLSQWRK